MVTTATQLKAGLDLHHLMPLPGQCFAIPTPESEGVVKGIYLPDSCMSRNAPGFVAEIVAENAIVEPKEQATIRGTVGRICAFARWAGQRFTHANIKLIRYHLSIEHILAVYYKGEWLPLLSEGHEIRVTTSGDSVPRCRFCKSKGQGNMILDGSGKCPCCGRNAKGRIPEKYTYKHGEKTTVLDHPLTMTEEERKIYG